MCQKKLKLLAFIILLLALLLSQAKSSTKDEFNEYLTIESLPDGKLLTHFQFSVKLRVAKDEDKFNHYNLFPRAIGQIIQSYSTRELHLTFTQGRWDYEEWGYPPSPSAGTGVELWAWLWKNEKLDKNWKSLTNALAGLFCASLNFIDDTKTVRPQLSFRPEGPYNDTELSVRSELRYGSLPHENICTENLTPWIKLLPCKSTAGIASLLNGHELYNSNFHAMAIHVRPVCQDRSCTNKQLEILQTLTTVVDPVRNEGKRDWSLNKIYQRQMSRICPLASKSKLMLILPDRGNYSVIPEPNFIVNGLSGHKDDKSDIAIYDLKETPQSLDISMEWNEEKFEYDDRPIQPRVFAHRYFSGYGQERGGIKVHIFNKNLDTFVPIIYYDVIPWYLKLYLHTLKFHVNGKHTSAEAPEYPVKELYYQPAVDRARPAVVEARLLLPPNSITTLSIDFDKVFLKYTEYPPDANRGFDVGSAVITTIDLWHYFSSENYESNSSARSPPQIKIPVRVYTETLLINLPTPDFSMPYNVITLTCTVIALFFGSMFNLLTRSFVALPQKVESKGKGKNDEKKDDLVDRSSGGNDVIKVKKNMNGDK